MFFSLIKLSYCASPGPDPVGKADQYLPASRDEINNPLSFVLNNMQVLRRDVAAAMAILEIYRQAHPTLEQTEPQLAAETAALEERSDLPYLLTNLDRFFDKTGEGIRAFEKAG
jgi:hypothetical protein